MRLGKGKADLQTGKAGNLLLWNALVLHAGF